MAYKDYIPVDSFEENEDQSGFLDFIPEPKPEFVPVEEGEVVEDLSDLTKKDLLVVAKAKGVEVTPRMSKEHILSAIEELEEE